MKKHSIKMRYTSPYLIDENSKIANSFGAKTTPHIFLLNNKRILVYKGAIDDNYKDATLVKTKYVENAVDALLTGTPVKVTKTKAIGCSIKV